MAHSALYAGARGQMQPANTNLIYRQDYFMDQIDYLTTNN